MVYDDSIEVVDNSIVYYKVAIVFLLGVILLLIIYSYSIAWDNYNIGYINCQNELINRSLGWSFDNG